MSEHFDPYASPKTSPLASDAPSVAELISTPSLEEARRALAAHVADAAAIANDARECGGRYRRPTVVFGAVGLIVGLATAIAGPILDDPIVWIVFGMTAGFSLLFFFILLAIDLLVAPRNSSAPDRLMLAYLRACRFARFGYAWSCLAPTARNVALASPELPPVVTQPITVVPATPSAYGNFLKAFAVNGGNQQRLMVQKRVQLLDVRGDLARVEIEVRYESVSRAAMVVGLVAFIVWRPLILVYLIMYYVLRKTHVRVAQKALLRGNDGLWYLLDGDPTRSDEVDGAGGSLST